LANDKFEVGHYEIVFSDHSLPSGVYLCRIETTVSIL